MATQKKILDNIRIVGIGSGNVATHIFRGLAIAGVDVVQVYSRNHRSAEQLASLCQAQPITQLSEIDTGADVYIIAIVDDAVKEFANQLITHLPDQALIAHTTGSIEMQVINSDVVRPQGVFYPLQTFDKMRDMDLYQIPILIEANDLDSGQLLATLARKISGSVHYIDSKKRQHIHLAAVSSCNFVNHLLSTAYKYLEDNDLDPHLLDPLMQETLKKFTDRYPADTQTGPAKRGDLGTIAKHESLLQSNAEMTELYQVITKQIRNRYS